MSDQFFGLTDTGRRRKNNEDAFITAYTADSNYIIACVIDGVGGYSGGEVAAETAREAILSTLSRPSGEIIPLLRNCFNYVNEKILADKIQVKEHSQMACVATLALVDIANNQFYYAHVGDTRLYLLRDQSLVKISHDQSFVGFLEDSGRLSEVEAMTHPKRNEINKALGFEGSLNSKPDYVETGQSPFLSGDMLLLCSDGLTDMVNKASITDIITTQSSLKEKCRQLIDAANNNGGNDNITAVLVQNNKEQLQHSATRPTPATKKVDEKTDGQIGSEHSATPNKQPSRSKGSRALVILLCLLILILLAANVYQLSQSKNPEAASRPERENVPVKKTTSVLQLKLQRAIDSTKGHVVILSDTAYRTAIIVNSAINIKRDSLVIKAKGKIVLKCDTGYSGPSMSLASTCKSIIIDSLAVAGFTVGITCYGDAVQLKNVFFENCAVQVQNSWALPSKRFLNGKLPPAVFSADSLAHNGKK
jgi:serine/threonine protein phosphatase PrpC